MTTPKELRRKRWSVIFKWVAVSGWFCIAHHCHDALLFGITCTIGVFIASYDANAD
jgi:hypothetical protein